MNRVLRSVLLLAAAIVLIGTPRARRPGDDTTGTAVDAGIELDPSHDDLTRPCGEAELLVERELACTSTAESRRACHALGPCCFMAYPLPDPSLCRGAVFSAPPPQRNAPCDCSCSPERRERERRARTEPPCTAP